jgi:predicted RNA-binding protein with RPS1 domain
VTVAAAESDAAPVAEQAAAPAAKRSLASIQPNEVVEGRVVSIQSFGAFVDIGAEAQGLVHVSQLADGFVKNVADVVKMGDVLKVKVLSVDVEGKRLALSRKGLAPRPAAAAGQRRAEDVEEVVAEEESDPNSAEVDGLAFFVEDADDAADDEEIDPAEVEIVDDIPAEVAREIAIACEDLVTGTVTAVDASGVTVSYTLSDGTPVQGVIAAAELLAPAYLVEGEDSPDEAEEYVEVDDINPAQYYKVGDSISCAVFDVEEGGVPALTQRLPEEADDELAELAEEMDQIDDVDDMSDALLIQGLWAAAEAVDEDEDGPAENARHAGGAGATAGCCCVS